METTKQKARWYGPKQIGLIDFTGILMLIDACIVGGSSNTVLPAIAEARGWDANYLIVWAGIACILDGVGVLIWARLSRKNAKLLAAIALFAQAICLVIFGFTTNLAILIIMIILMGISGSAFCSTCVNTLTANWWPTKKGVVLGWSTMGIILMSVVYVPYIPSAYAAWGIGMTSVYLAIFIAIMGAISLLFVKDTPEAAGTTPDGLTGMDLAQVKDITRQLQEYKSPFTFKKMISSGNNWLVALSMGLGMTVAMSFIGSAIPAFLSFGYDYGTAASVFAVGTFPALVGSWAMGMIDQKFGTKKATIMWLILEAIGVFFMFFMAKSLAAVWIATCVFMFANGAAKNLTASYVATLYGRWDYPAAFQMIGTIAYIFCGAGVMIIGLFPSYTSLYIFDAVVIVICIIMAALVKPHFIGKPDTEEIAAATVAE